MYHFVFYYENGKVHEFENIDRVVYSTFDGTAQLGENQILSHNFELNHDYYLFSKSSTFTVSRKGLYCIEVTAE